MEHVACSEDRLSLLIVLPLVTHEVSVATDDFLFVRIPHDELLIAILACVELIDINALASTAAGSTESDFSETTYLLHYIRRVVSRNDKNLVIALIGHAELLLRSKFADKQLFRNWLYYFFFLHIITTPFCPMGIFPRKGQEAGAV